MYIIAGLGNPTEEYESTRHNVGRIVLEYFRVKNNFSDWTPKKKIKALTAEGKIGKSKVLLIEPDNFMNNSGKSLAFVVTSAKKAAGLVVVYDDIDLPLGTFKISFNRGSGGHRGVESVIKSVKTKAFVRLRVGVATTTPSGKIRKPKGEQKVLDFLMGDFKPKERDILKKVSKKAAEALEMIVLEGKEKAAGEFNSR
jgi:PTH1 family peptidyl-tRNA hydrolase